MKFSHKTTALAGKTITFSLAAWLLTACAGQNFTSLFPAIDSQDNPAITDTENETADLDLEDIELKMCFDQELVALSKTGVWNEQSTQISRLPTDDLLFDFPIVRTKQVEMYLDLFQNDQREQFSRWLSRSSAYLPTIKKELKDAGLPLDLAYLAMIESGFNPLARSRANAIGLWQFMKGTGKQYSLQIDNYVDERRNVLKATQAAVNYLNDLYLEFGDWHLAVAAYNGGPGKIRSGLKRYQVDSFWELAGKRYLSLETKRYVPKLIAALLIAKQPEKYGFTEIDYADPLQYDTIEVGPGLTLEAVAMISDCNLKQIKKLNQELRQNRTPLNQETYAINVPAGRGKIAKANYPRLHSVVSTGYKTHKIQRGDTLTQICKRYGVNKTTLLKVNNLRSSTLRSGQNLRIPYSTVSYQLLPKGSYGALAAYKDNLILHRVKRGETLSKISREYQVSPEMIVAWNGLKSVHAIKAGQQLALYINNEGPIDDAAGSKTTSIARNTAADNTVVIAADQHKQYISSIKTEYEWYDVQDGDSLWAISRKFSISAADLKKLNNLKTNLIYPGSKLKLKKV
jgi:membrane-bound lytic murein transglycosylase D